MGTRTGGRFRRRQFRLAGAACAAWTLLTTPARALDWQAGPVHFEQLQRSSRHLLLRPSLQNALNLPRSLSLLGQGQLSFDGAIQALLQDELNNSMIATKSVDTTPQGLGLSQAVGGQSLDYSFYVGGVPLCGYQLRAHQLPDGTAFVLGTLPDIDSYEIPPNDWPDLELSAEQAAIALRAVAATSDLRLGSSSKCVYIGGGKLFPVWQIVMYGAGKPYKILADAYTTLKLDQMFFDATGSASAVARNINDPVQTVPLNDLSGDGTLSNAYLKTSVPSPYVQAKESSNTFKYTQNEQQFSEVQAFVHANVHFAWFQSLGFEWYGPKPMQLQLHSSRNGANNALFTPGSSSDNTFPSIQIDNGDGIVLQNLITDGDVVSHEFGHHVIYKTLQTTSGESLVLHEGLADSFVFLRTLDPNLGRTICPSSSGACQKQGQALRSGLLSVTYNDPTWTAWSGASNALGHRHGQLISGLIWDLVKNNGMSNSDVTNLTYKAVSFFKTDSGLCDFAASLLSADQALFQGANQAKITSALTARGMSAFLPTATPACATLRGGASVQQDGGSSNGSKGDGKGGGWLKCGSVALERHKGAAGWLLVVLLFPLLTLISPRKPLRAVARAWRRR